MTPWQWWAAPLADLEDEPSWPLGEFETRSEAIYYGMKATKPGEIFCIIEARSSTAREHDGADRVPFLRSRKYDEIYHPVDLDAEIAAERFATWLALAPILGDMAELNRDNDDGDVTGYEVRLFLQRIHARLEAIGQGLHRFDGEG